jgi:hypothetical protein
MAKMGVSSHCSICGSTFRKAGEQDEFSHSAVGKIQNENQSMTSDGFMTQERERMASDHKVNLESGTTFFILSSEKFDMALTHIL